MQEIEVGQPITWLLDAATTTSLLPLPQKEPFKRVLLALTPCDAQAHEYEVELYLLESDSEAYASLSEKVAGASRWLYAYVSPRYFD